MRRAFVGILSSTFLIWLLYQHWPVKVQVHSPEKEFEIKMPRKDKKRLDFFFREVCFICPWSYTIAGSKPVSFHQYKKPFEAIKHVLFHDELKSILLACFWPPDIHEICFLFNPTQWRTKLGWESLKKYHEYFPESRFALFESVHGDTVVLTIVNKTRLIEVVNQHRPDFQKNLEDLCITPEDLIENDKIQLFLEGFLTNGQIGTLLGYGRDNAHLFELYEKTNPSQRPMASMWFEEEDEWIERINDKDTSFQPWEISDIFYPPFACDPNSKETRQLKETYREEREKIIKCYEGKDIVEVTLSLLSRS